MAALEGGVAGVATASGQCYRIHPKPSVPAATTSLGSRKNQLDKSLIVIPSHSPELVSHKLHLMLDAVNECYLGLFCFYVLLSSLLFDDAAVFSAV